MANFRIFTESNADIKFLSDYVLERFKVVLTESDFYSLNSWSGYKKGGNIIASIRENSDEGKETILILDADGSRIKRLADVERDFQNYGIDIRLFLFPDNISNGNLEHLLCKIAVEHNILRCFEEYEICIAGHQAPVVKSKVFAYLDALLPSKNKKNNRHDLIQEANRNYGNPDHWNLQHEYLQPLHDFLSPFFIEAN